MMKRKLVNRLYDHEKKSQKRNYHLKLIENLPEPVQRYFRFTLSESQPFVQRVNLEHDGQFKPGVEKGWLAIRGEQHFTTDEPGFVWIGKTRLFTAHDFYIHNSGVLKVYLFGLIRIVHERGSHTDQAELLRWLGESVWFPTNLLPSEKLHWTPIDENSARVQFTHNGLDVYYDVFFSETGEIIRLETKRYMSSDKMENWTGRLDNYRSVNGMMIPMKIEAAWQLEEGEHIYARFRVQTINHKFAK